MLQSFYNGLSGLFGFSRGLNTVSNNVSNMNTPGFRGKNSFFRSVNGGMGTTVSEGNARLQSGEVRQTGNATDLALNGSGFFIIKDLNGTLHYTRAGQFQFSGDSILIDAATKGEVMGMDANSNLQRIDISKQRTIPAQATSKVSISGVLNSIQTSASVENIKIFDSKGAVHTLRLSLTRGAVGTWQVEAKDENTLTVASGEIRYGPDNTPLVGFNQLVVKLGNTAETVTLNFGDPGTFTGSYQNSAAQSALGAKSLDGHAVLGISTINFDENGQLKLVYSNGEKQDGMRLAMASFADETALTQVNGSLYSASENLHVSLGRAGEGGSAKVQGGAIELSNVDLAQEFADMMVIQRGYQASSRIMSVANEMVEQLYNGTRGG